MIRAGHINEITPSSGDWVFLDIGFANTRNRSCGLLFGGALPIEVTFHDAVQGICAYTQNSNSSINLVIEAPLSVSFDKNGNPKGRSIEKQNRKQRYWYVPPGVTVMVAALYLIRAIVEISFRNEVRLFEGFVSFKDSDNPSDHSTDVLSLQAIVNAGNTKAIIAPDELKTDEADKIQSAFLVAGLDFGIPPILLQNGSQVH